MREWLLLFYPNKCKIMRIANCNVRNNGYSMNGKITETSSKKEKWTLHKVYVRFRCTKEAVAEYAGLPLDFKSIKKVTARIAYSSD